jgi:hypothetical protein
MCGFVRIFRYRTDNQLDADSSKVPSNSFLHEFDDTVDADGKRGHFIDKHIGGVHIL